MEEIVVLTVKDFVVSVVLGGAVWLFLYICNDLVWKPRRLGSKLGKQGIRGPPPCLLFGNVSEMKRIQIQNQSVAAPKDLQHHLWFSNLFPYFEQWRKKYGMPSLSHFNRRITLSLSLSLFFLSLLHKTSRVCLVPDFKKLFLRLVLFENCLKTVVENYMNHYLHIGIILFTLNLRPYGFVF